MSTELYNHKWKTCRAEEQLADYLRAAAAIVETVAFEAAPYLDAEQVQTLLAAVCDIEEGADALEERAQAS